MNLPIPTLALVLSLVSLVAVGYCLWQIQNLRRMRKTFFAGPSAGDLEEVILNLQQELGNSRAEQLILEKTLRRLEHEANLSVQKVGLVRFNPFNDGGGNFSFSLALLDGHNSGVVVTSMYGREQNRIYTKKIEDGTCDTKLTDEEQEAVILAHQQNKNRQNMIPRE